MGRHGRRTRHARKPIVYWGAHSTPERDARIRAFHQDPRGVLIAPRAGSEGRNLQFCNVLVNYDLPWNPMVVEQRIGRLHRIGQTREVHIVTSCPRRSSSAHSSIERVFSAPSSRWPMTVVQIRIVATYAAASSRADRGQSTRSGKSIMSPSSRSS